MSQAQGGHLLHLQNLQTFSSEPCRPFAAVSQGVLSRGKQKVGNFCTCKSCISFAAKPASLLQPSPKPAQAAEAKGGHHLHLQNLQTFCSETCRPFAAVSQGRLSRGKQKV